MSDEKPQSLPTRALRNAKAAAPIAKVADVTASVLTPTTVIGGRYEVLEPLGAGGMGRVYKAHDDKLQRFVAIKLMRATVASDPNAAQFTQRFSDEALLPAEISHPNIITIHDRGEHEGSVYFVMEYIPRSRSLEAMLEEIEAQNLAHPEGAPQYLRLDLLREYLQQACAGLGAIHESRPGAWHRDIKLGNLLVYELASGGHGLKIIDFGVAHVPGGDLTQDGNLLGTPAYMSPEYFEFDGEEPKRLDHRSDLFALGIVAYKCLAMRHPWPAIKNIRTAMWVHQKRKRAILPSHFRPELKDSGWDVLVMRALARDRGRRYQTAAEFRADLLKVDTLGAYSGDEAAQGSELDVANELETPSMAETTPSSSGSVPTYKGPLNLVGETPVSARMARALRSKWVWLTVGIGAVLVGVGAAVAWSALRSTPPAETTAAVPAVVPTTRAPEAAVGPEPVPSPAPTSPGVAEPVAPSPAVQPAAAVKHAQKRPAKPEAQPETPKPVAPKRRGSHFGAFTPEEPAAPTPGAK
jgi:eukaryotic-like serine/threonine-protein kinase